MNEKRQAPATTTTTITPKNVPAYASPCSGTARYSSACSCAGVTPVTITAPTPTVTATVTECDSYGTKCNGICRDLYFDENNCGTCGNVVGYQPLSLPILSSPTTTNHQTSLTQSPTPSPVPHRQPMPWQMPLPRRLRVQQHHPLQRHRPRLPTLQAQEPDLHLRHRPRKQPRRPLCPPTSVALVLRQERQVPGPHQCRVSRRLILLDQFALLRAGVYPGLWVV